ncbi:hypothetical protein M422DRAFT_254727 [Sphaerobolus stellatus SS14]|uniref:Dipeptidyl-peptidase V n=1 Tax=Sphaerobolus stellatus (strain SS14) TaxID=990650 RepID=A0A0C9VUV3_SPHS4|nr:hypothetical protein M422DRAFT_254727 [Sphaerobolus stellatus SS14]
MAFTIDNIVSSVRLSDVVISPDGSKVVYRAAAALKTDCHSTAALWYTSDTSKPDSVKQLTSGLHNDTSPKWHPDGKSLFFLSDRHWQGGSKQVYKLSLDGPGEAALLNDLFKDKKREVADFKVSPDGKYIAFSSADEPSAEEQKKESDKDDAIVWGDTTLNAKLRLYSLSAGTVRTIVDRDNVIFFTWSPDSKSIAFSTSSRPEIDAKYHKTSLYTVSVLPGSGAPSLKHILDNDRSAIDTAIWPFDDCLYAIQPYDPQSAVDADSVHVHALNSPLGGSYQGKAFYGGETEDVPSLLNIQSSEEEFAVLVNSGLDTRIDIINRKGIAFTLYSCKSQSAFDNWDTKKINGEYIIAFIKSSGPNKEPPNLWIGKTNKKEVSISVFATIYLGKPSSQPSQIESLTKLSSHFAWVSENKLGKTEIFEWKGQDGVQLNGMAWFPSGVDSTKLEKPLPTILVIHGGPYHLDKPQLVPSYGSASWPPYLAEKGYLVLQPNYRGGSGRGSKFARAAYHGMGTIEWSDVSGMIDEAVKHGLADKDKLGISGWSQGGFLTAWGVSQTKDKFKCGVMGAGVSDWGSMVVESDVPEIEGRLGGAAPWLGSDARLAGDPIRHIEGIETALLIIHGEKDLRVPVGQGIGFHRGLRRKSKYPDRHILVTYPREPHSFVERKHAEDVLRRILEHFDAWLK